MSSSSPSPAAMNNNEHEDGSVFVGTDSNPDLSHSVANPNPNEQVKEVIGKQEDKAVLCLRTAVLLVLLAAAVGVSTAVYLYLDKSEETAFEEQFASDAAKVIEETGKTIVNTLGPLDALSVNLVAYAHTLPKRLPNNQTSAFPFVVMPSFGLQATKMLRNSKGFNVYFAPKLTPDMHQEYLKFANETHKEWIDEALAIAEGDPDYDGIIYKDYKTCPDLFVWGGEPVHEPRPDLGYFLPKALEYPVATGAGAVEVKGPACPYNFDLARSSKAMPKAINLAIHQRKSLIGTFLNMNYNRSDPAQELQYQGLTSFYRTLLPEEEDPEEPACTIVSPVFDTLDSVYLEQSAHNRPEDFVGYFGLTIQFKGWIRNVLPENSNGIIVVVEQSCGRPFTYRIDGAKATFLGVGDHHDSKYDDMVVTQVLQALGDPSLVDHEISYTGLPVSTDFCPSTIKIYPSQDMEDNHRTNTPLLLTIVAAGIFVFTSLVFIFYDFVVEIRQQKVMSRALQSGAIVSSLFPEEVAQKLYEENKARFEKEEQHKNFRSGEKPETMRSSVAVADSNQIAQLHPACTVFFADLAGFTAWSSKRQPSEVFQLLETLYGAFDKIAERRRVFKVETIGDCYVAITGCPKPQKDHAVIMCKFASDCMAKMMEITAETADTFGADTADLGFRVGLHSGPVTAGVLRGQKARFQLFGDTVNTAARMESNGVPGRIHISQDTANELISCRKSAWLTMREDKIEAKGKGLMQTYYANPNNAPNTIRTSSGMSSYDAVSNSDDEEDCGDDIRDIVSGFPEPQQEAPPSKNDASKASIYSV